VKHLKTYDQYINENAPAFLYKHSIDNHDGTIVNPLGEEDVDEYMFFQNLKTIKECVDSLLTMDPVKVNAILKDGHAWAVDHISTSKDDVEEVTGFLKGRLSVNEAKEDKSLKKSDFERTYTMTPVWWEAWKKENEGKFEISKDAFSKVYSIKKGKKEIFIFDYSRGKVFTNEEPVFFNLKDDLTTKELIDMEKKADDLTKPPSVEEPAGDKKAEDEASAEVDLDKEKEEE
jgi:hypothetical protein